MRSFIRLVTVDVTKDSSTCLACVYLNEYKIAVAAFTLHGSENKLVRVRGIVISTLCYSIQGGPF